MAPQNLVLSSELFMHLIGTGTWRPFVPVSWKTLEETLHQLCLEGVPELPYAPPCRMRLIGQPAWSQEQDCKSNEQVH